MRRSPFIALLTAVVVVAACGSDDAGGGGLHHPDDPDVALVRVGGDDDIPTILIGGDGWVYLPARAEPGSSGDVQSLRRPAIAPLPPEPTPMVRRKLTDDGVRIVMNRAEELGLLDRPPRYSEPNVTDSFTTMVTLVDDDGTYRHDAYALGSGRERGARAKLAAFVEEVVDIDAMVGADNIGPERAYVPDVYAVFVGGTSYFDDAESRWPAGVPVEAGCIELPTERFPSGVAGRYVYEVDGRAEVARVVPDLPGDDCE